ncbi:hypothetical protein LZL87_013292 [Fusarium oxysporum]|nr:hypothetical protein LZL87_013292 [Fusarium oxysporum]
MARKVADIRYSPIRLALESSANITIAFIVCPLGAMLVVGSLIPIPDAETPHPIPCTGQISNVRRAGFLWSDGMIWLQALPEEMLDSLNDHVDEDEEHWSIEGSHRVFFQDKFLTRYPWEVQKYPRIKTRPQWSRWTPQWSRWTPQWSRWTSSGDYVRLHDPATARYLCVIPGERVDSNRNQL